MINPLESTGSTGNVSNGTMEDKNNLQDQFLEMLMAQIQHQDPLNPMEPSEFTSQLAQLSTVEQLESVNKNLNYQQLYLASINNSQALGFIGHEVMAAGNSVHWDGENSGEINYSLEGNATRVVVNVFDKNDTLVRTIHLGEQQKGWHKISWDGSDSTGQQLPEGTYTFKVMASDSSGDAINSSTMLSGVVDGIDFEDGVTYVTVQGQKIPIGDIIEINSVKEPEEGQVEEDDSSIVDDVFDTLRTVGNTAMKIVPFALL